MIKNTSHKNDKGPSLISKKVDALPIINNIMDKLKINELFDKYVPRIDKRQILPPSRGLGVLIRNILIAREPLYHISEWATQYDESLLRLEKGELSFMNDDRIGRCLDSLFKSDRAGLITSLTVEAIQAFHLDTSEFHNDSTSISFAGNYETADGKPKDGTPTKQITYGHNKDHRPDLKQLLFILTTTSDGTIPIWCKVEHGNVADDQTHIETWNALCRITGKPDFLYVADSKLCTRENLTHIDSQKGSFITVLPRTRSETSWFFDWIQQNEIPWEDLFQRKSTKCEDTPDNVYRGFESPLLSSEGYRIIWIWSSQKEKQDSETRDRRIKKTIDELEFLRNNRMKSPKSRLKTISAVEKAVETILKKNQTDKWFEININTEDRFEFKQAKAGRPSKDTPFIKEIHKEPVLTWKLKDDAIKYDNRTDGLFPLVLNNKEMSMKQALASYKHQPFLEKRYEQLKSVYDVMPVFLKSPSRIEAFLYIYFVVMLIQSLVEREIRQQMKKINATSLPLYPENRPCTAPTANRVFGFFSDVRRHILIDSNGTFQSYVVDSLSKTQCLLLKLLRISTEYYFEDNWHV